MPGMLGRGYLYALHPEEARLAEACTDAAEMRVLLEAWRHAGARISELDVAWLAIHRSLAHGDSGSLLARAVLGGRLVTDDQELLATLVRASEVAAVAGALETLSEDDFRDRCFATHAPEPDGESEELDLLYAWGWFQRLRGHYREAAGAGCAVLFAAQKWRRGAIA